MNYLIDFQNSSIEDASMFNYLTIPIKTSFPMSLYMSYYLNYVLVSFVHYLIQFEFIHVQFRIEYDKFARMSNYNIMLASPKINISISIKELLS